MEVEYTMKRTPSKLFWEFCENSQNNPVTVTRMIAVSPYNRLEHKQPSENEITLF